MENQNHTHKLEQDWDRAVQAAHENSPRGDALSRDMLDSVAGLEIKSGVRAGSWTQSLSCDGGCSAECAE